MAGDHVSRLPLLLSDEEESQAEDVLNAVMPTLEQGLENHFRRCAPSCARLEWDRSEMFGFVHIPDRDEVCVRSYTAPYIHNVEPSKEHLQLEELHRTAGILGVECLRYLAQTLVDESSYMGRIDCYYTEEGIGYHYMTDPHKQIEASITELNRLNQLLLKDITPNDMER
jgi:hypothetical protein